jgi:hypothetical protein
VVRSHLRDELDSLQKPFGPFDEGDK